MNREIASLIAQRLRKVRSSPSQLASTYEAQYSAYITALFDLGHITRDELLSLYTLGSKAYLRVCGVSPKKRRNAFANRVNPEEVQDEPASEPIFAPAALPRVSVRGVLGQRGPSAAVVKPLLRINLIFFEDGDATAAITLNRCEFPPLGKHWAPPKVMEAYKSPKGHAFCRA